DEFDVVDVEQRSTASGESDIQIVKTTRAGERPGHSLEVVPASRPRDGGNAGQRAGGGVEPDLESAAARLTGHAGRERGRLAAEVHVFEGKPISVGGVADFALGAADVDFCAVLRGVVLGLDAGERIDDLGRDDAVLD